VAYTRQVGGGHGKGIGVGEERTYPPFYSMTHHHLHLQQVVGSRVAGCLNTTNPMYVMVGCSQRRNGDKEEKIECVCTGDLCNNDVHTAYLHGASSSLIHQPRRRIFAICIVLTFVSIFRFQ
jgi:hypothetical protein